ncbi:polar amino acid transport system substrate-binding protein [Variovorax sp. HW608]|uniref:transporter substrate-binding domain-containing protein n=1 Tax=Variovorax sp. HW608 TaxID=1034889 RepID=UPI000820020B|nr:transporter substrate-binding domain-containing protein [Variovorax sp. HW608]SCK12765.1 polar amino acid transport system substrate-binding protein [Variovorax sp. HW608]
MQIHPPGTVNRRTAAAGMAGFLVLALGFMSPSAMAQSDSLARIRSSGKIRIAIDLSVPPWSYKDDKLEMKGSEVDTAKLLAKDLGVELEVVPTNSANRIPLLMTNRADVVISAMTITPERLKTIDFSRPYSGISTYVAAPKSMAVRTPADLVGKKIAVTRGTTNDADITRMAPPGAEVVRFEDESTTMTAVVSGQMDVTALATTLIEVINQRNPGKQLEPKLLLQNSLFGVGMRKNDAALKEWVNKWIEDRLGSGDLQTIYKKHQGAEIPAEVLKGGT